MITHKQIVDNLRHVIETSENFVIEERTMNRIFTALKQYDDIFEDAIEALVGKRNKNVPAEEKIEELKLIFNVKEKE